MPSGASCGVQDSRAPTCQGRGCRPRATGRVRPRTPVREPGRSRIPAEREGAGPFPGPPAGRGAGGTVPSRPRTCRPAEGLPDRTPVRGAARRRPLRQAGGPGHRLRLLRPGCTTCSAGGAARRDVRRTLGPSARDPQAAAAHARVGRAGRSRRSAGGGGNGRIAARWSAGAKATVRSGSVLADETTSGRSPVRTQDPRGEPFRPSGLVRARIGLPTSAQTMRCRPAGPVRAGNGLPPRRRGTCTAPPAGARAESGDRSGCPERLPAPVRKMRLQSRFPDRADAQAGRADGSIEAAGGRDRLERARCRPPPDRWPRGERPPKAPCAGSRYGPDRLRVVPVGDRSHAGIPVRATARTRGPSSCRTSRARRGRSTPAAPPAEGASPTCIARAPRCDGAARGGANRGVGGSGDRDGAAPRLSVPGAGCGARRASKCRAPVGRRRHGG
jgi:hypothetical protein